MRIKQSLCYPLFPAENMSLDAYFAKLAEIGFQAFETWERPANFMELVQAAQKRGLALASFGGHGTLASGLIDKTQHDRIEAELRTSIDIAADLGTPGVICFSGNRIEGLSDEQAIDVAAAGLSRVIGHAEKKGVNLNMELLNSKVNHPGYACDKSAFGLAVCKKVGSPRAKLLYDIYHMQIMEGDLIRTITANIQYIGHFHTAGNPGRNDMDDTQELNYRGICKAIAATPYEYYVGHEFRTKRADKFEGLREAFELCNQ